MSEKISDEELRAYTFSQRIDKCFMQAEMADELLELRELSKTRWWQSEIQGLINKITEIEKERNKAVMALTILYGDVKSWLYDLNVI